MCDCEAEGKPTHIADIIKAADTILKVEIVITDPPPTLRKGKSGPGLRMEYKGKVVQMIKGIVTPAIVDIKQLVFNECPPPTLQGQYFISGAMGGKKGKGKHENLFYLDPCGIALPNDTPLKTALETLGNDATNLCPDGKPVKDCDDACTQSTCAEEGAQCIASKCAEACTATWASNGTSPKVMCPSGLPSGAISDAIANLEERIKLLIQAREAFKLGQGEEGFRNLAIVAKLSCGGEEYRVPPTTTTVETTTEAPAVDTWRPSGLNGLLELAKRLPQVGKELDSYAQKAADAQGKPFVPKFGSKKRKPLSPEARRLVRLAKAKARLNKPAAANDAESNGEGAAGKSAVLRKGAKGAKGGKKGGQKGGKNGGGRKGGRAGAQSTAAGPAAEVEPPTPA